MEKFIRVKVSSRNNSSKKKFVANYLCGSLSIINYLCGKELSSEEFIGEEFIRVKVFVE